GVAVVALPGVEDPGDTADIAKTEAVVAVLRAPGGEDDRIGREGLRKPGVVVPLSIAPVTARHHDKPPDGAGLHRVDDRVSDGKDRGVGASRDQVAAGEILRRLAPLRMLDQGREVFLPVLRHTDVLEPRIPDK